jgi:outer membrane PBP1 activator LpoA protein
MFTRLLTRAALLFISFSLAGCSGWFGDDKLKMVPVEDHGILAASSETTVAPKQVALLLPLQGKLADVGQAVRDGFLAAYNAAPVNARPEHINIIDTNSVESVQAAYQQAVKQGADFIIGPIAKPDVQAISNMPSLSVPTLALNYLDMDQAVPQLYQFGLSPLDEARQAAALARQKGAQAALVIAPAGEWGTSVAHAFEDQWQALGGTVTDSLFFTGTTTETLSQQIRELLHFSQTDEHATFSRRRDFDVIFLATSATVARQIRSLLKLYYAGDVPIYATSLVYSGKAQASASNDLNGITFCDAPWALNDRNAYPDLHQRLALFWPLNFQQNARLYALGVDAYQVMTQLNQLADSSQKNLSGATGVLSINDQHRVVRQLECAQLRNGVPELLQ